MSRRSHRAVLPPITRHAITEPGHKPGCNGLIEGHIERVPDDDPRRDRFRVVLRCHCGRRSRVASPEYRRLDNAEATLRQVERKVYL